MINDTTSVIYLLLKKYPVVNAVSMDYTGDTALVDNFKNGIIGINLLRHFDVIFDYPHNKLYLKPNGK